MHLKTRHSCQHSVLSRTARRSGFLCGHVGCSLLQLLSSSASLRDRWTFPCLSMFVCNQALLPLPHTAQCPPHLLRLSRVVLPCCPPTPGADTFLMLLSSSCGVMLHFPHPSATWALLQPAQALALSGLPTCPPNHIPCWVATTATLSPIPNAEGLLFLLGL